MIFLYDLNFDRAMQSCFAGVALYRDSAWRASDNLAIDEPHFNESWFLVHATDWKEFTEVRNEMGVNFRTLPVVRFTGDDPSALPKSGYWVRSRPVSATSPFTHDELSAMDKWIKSGCPERDLPLICSGPAAYPDELVAVYLIALASPADGDVVNLGVKDTKKRWTDTFVQGLLSAEAWMKAQKQYSERALVRSRTEDPQTLCYVRFSTGPWPAAVFVDGKPRDGFFDSVRSMLREG